MVFKLSKKVIKSYITRKYVIILICIPFTISWMVGSLLTLFTGNLVFILAVIIMFMLRFKGLKYWMIYDEKKFPKKRGDRLYAWEPHKDACRRYDWEKYFEKR